MKDISILINSCAKYSDMWGNVVLLYDKYWPNHPELIIVTDEIAEHNQQIRLVKFSGDMSDRIISAVKNIETKYVFLSFDDYYPCKPVNTKKLDALLNEMEAKSIDYCRIFFDPPTKGEKDSFLKYKILLLTRVYEVNFYPSIWKKESLLKVLKKGEDIWKTEARLTRRFKEKGFKGIYVKENGIFDFVDVVRKGKYLRSAYHFLKRNNLYISQRERRTIKETVLLNTRIFLSNHLPKKIKEYLKAKGRKKGAIYYSDYANTED